MEVFTGLARTLVLLSQVCAAYKCMNSSFAGLLTCHLPTLTQKRSRDHVLAAHQKAACEILQAHLEFLLCCIVFCLSVLHPNQSIWLLVGLARRKAVTDMQSASHIIACLCSFCDLLGQVFNLSSPTRSHPAEETAFINYDVWRTNQDWFLIYAQLC